MKISRKHINLAIVFATATVLFSSCNKGYGCPNNFQLNDSVWNVVQSAIAFIF